jgi:hypothetical protein
MRLAPRWRQSAALGAALFLVIAALVSTTGLVAAITNGVPDTTNRYEYVGLVTDRRTFTCSGALISPTLFVTSAHCFFQSGPEVLVTVAPNPRDGGFVAGQWYADPQFCYACGRGTPNVNTHDLAVVVLSSPITTPHNLYAQLPPPGLVDALAQNTPMTVVGYGVQDFTQGGGPRQGVTNFIRYYAPSLLVQTEKRLQETFFQITANPGQDRGGICYGDSGGPILLNDVILGINALVANPNCAGITYGFRLDTAAALAFIQGGYSTATVRR